MRDDGHAPCEHVVEVLAEQLGAVEQRLAELRTARDELRRLQRRAQRLDPADCGPEAICHIIEAGQDRPAQADGRSRPEDGGSRPEDGGGAKAVSGS